MGTKRVYTRLYLGRSVATGKLEMFRSATVPNQATHGGLYSHSTGPFRTKAGAQYMIDHPDCGLSARQCEKFVLKHAVPALVQ